MLVEILQNVDTAGRILRTGVVIELEDVLAEKLISSGDAQQVVEKATKAAATWRRKPKAEPVEDEGEGEE